eukprot:3759075-Ditylum_brightwellii.AAC.1
MPLQVHPLLDFVYKAELRTAPIATELTSTPLQVHPLLGFICKAKLCTNCLLYTSPSPRDPKTS